MITKIDIVKLEKELIVAKQKLADQECWFKVGDHLLVHHGSYDTIIKVEEIKYTEREIGFEMQSRIIHTEYGNTSNYQVSYGCGRECYTKIKLRETK